MLSPFGLTAHAIAIDTIEDLLKTLNGNHATIR